MGKKESKLYSNSLDMLNKINSSVHGIDDDIIKISSQNRKNQLTMNDYRHIVELEDLEKIDINKLFNSIRKSYCELYVGLNELRILYSLRRILKKVDKKDLEDAFDIMDADYNNLILEDFMDESDY